MKKIFTRTIVNEQIVDELIKLSWKDINKLQSNLGLSGINKDIEWNRNKAVYMLHPDEKITPQLLKNINIIYQKYGIGISDMLLPCGYYNSSYDNIFKNITLCVDALGTLDGAVGLTTHKNLWLIPLYYLLWLPRKIRDIKKLPNTQTPLSENNRLETIKDLNDAIDELVKKDSSGFFKSPDK